MTATPDTPAFVMDPKDVQRVIIGLMVMMALIVETAILLLPRLRRRWQREARRAGVADGRGDRR